MRPRVSFESPAQRAMLCCVICLGWLSTSCGSDSSGPIGQCASVAPLAVVVTVRDSATGQAAADGAIGTLVGGAADDTLFHVDSLTIEGGNELGTYTVTIDKPGYLTWSASNIHVTKVGPCGNVLPVDLSARLQPATL